MTTIAISKEIEFDAGHRVPMHLSKCVNPHGHRYRVRVTCVGEIVTDPSDPEVGMLTDFSALKEYLTVHVHDVLDHAMIIHRDDTVFLTAMSGTVGGLWSSLTSQRLRTSLAGYGSSWRVYYSKGTKPASEWLKSPYGRHLRPSRTTKDRND